jgi:hypothetical protein
VPGAAVDVGLAHPVTDADADDLAIALPVALPVALSVDVPDPSGGVSDPFHVPVSDPFWVPVSDPFRVPYRRSEHFSLFGESEQRPQQPPDHFVRPV